MKPYLIGQRVIVEKEFIAVVTRYDDRGRVWVRMPTGIDRWYALENIQPLPGNQL